MQMVTAPFPSSNVHYAINLIQSLLYGLCRKTGTLLRGIRINTSERSTRYGGLRSRVSTKKSFQIYGGLHGIAWVIRRPWTQYSRPYLTFACHLLERLTILF